MQAETLRAYPLEGVARSLGYRRDPDDDAPWRHLGLIVSINRRPRPTPEMQQIRAFLSRR